MLFRSIRDGDTLHIAIEISFAAAALGTTVDVQTLDGPISVDVKAGTQNGATISIRGKGMTRLRTSQRGDLIVHVEIFTPQKLSRKEEQLLKEFAEMRGEKVGDVSMKSNKEGLFAKLRDAFGR